MKLITEERFDDIEYITEASKDGEKKMYIEGIFLQTNRKNRNGRIYEDKIVRPVIEEYVKSQINEGRALGELEHPQSSKINLDRVSHRITKLEWNGDDVFGKALILNTPTGNIAKGLIEGGSKLGVSSRGMGSIEKRKDGLTYVKDDYMLSTVDIVGDPSAHDAFVNGILEGVEFLWDEKGNIVQSSVEAFEKNATETIMEQKHQIDESVQLKLLKQFLRGL